MSCDDTIQHDPSRRIGMPSLAASPTLTGILQNIWFTQSLDVYQCQEPLNASLDVRMF
jgi:hypothetical protein